VTHLSADFQQGAECAAATWILGHRGATYGRQSRARLVCCPSLPFDPIPFRNLPPFSVLASAPNPHNNDDESHRHSDPSIRSSPTPSPQSLNLPTEPRHLKFGTIYSRHGDFEPGSLRTLLVKGDRAKVQGAQCPRCFGGGRGVGYEVYTTEFVGEGCVCGSSGTSSWIWM
jgi:hypothetical protein